MSQAIIDRLISHVPFAVFDLETTGFSPDQGAEILEISVVRFIPGQPPEVILDTLIRPRGRVSKTEIHYIQTRDVVDAPTFKDAVPYILEALSDSVWVAYNAGFDVNFLTKMLKKECNIECTPVYLCTKNFRS